jgi:hypothetical protein
MVMKHNFLLLFLLFNGIYICNAQVAEQELDSITEKMIIVAGDSLVQSSIALE